jgi:GTPase SAR1 family protein
MVLSAILSDYLILCHRYATYTKYCSAVILVIDKDKLDSSQPIVTRTLNDIKLSRAATGRDIPLIVVINKV